MPRTAPVRPPSSPGVSPRGTGSIVTIILITTAAAVTYQAGGKLLLTLSGPATGATSLTYQGHNGTGPWITNTTGTGLLAFTMPVT